MVEDGVVEDELELHFQKLRSGEAHFIAHVGHERVVTGTIGDAECEVAGSRDVGGRLGHVADCIQDGAVVFRVDDACFAASVRNTLITATVYARLDFEVVLVADRDEIVR